MAKLQITKRTKWYFGIAIAILAFVFALWPYTQGRGWGWPDVLAWIINRVPFFHVDPQTLYGWEAKVLAHSVDILFLAFLVFLVLTIVSLFKKDKKTDDDSHELYQRLDASNQAILIAIKGLREDMNKRGDQSGTSKGNPTQPTP